MFSGNQLFPQQHIEYTLTGIQLMKHKMLRPWHIEHSDSICILDQVCLKMEYEMLNINQNQKGRGKCPLTTVLGKRIEKNKY